MHINSPLEVQMQETSLGSALFVRTSERVECCKQILTILQNPKRLHWRYIITGDESWFFYHTPYGYQWIPEDEEAQEDKKTNNMSPKILVILFLNPNGIAILKVLPAGQTLNGNTFLQSIIEPLCEYPQFKEAKKSRTLSNFLIDKKFSKVPHPPYSPDLAPSDFYLFAKLKDKLKGRKFRTVEEIQNAIIEEFMKIPKDKLNAVFDGWIRKCQECIDRNGSYIE